MAEGEVQAYTCYAHELLSGHLLQVCLQKLQSENIIVSSFQEFNCFSVINFLDSRSC